MANVDENVFSALRFQRAVLYMLIESFANQAKRLLDRAYVVPLALAEHHARWTHEHVKYCVVRLELSVVLHADS